MNLNDSEKDECKDKVRQPNLDESETKSLITKMNGLTDAIQNDIERYRNESLMNQNVEFVTENSKLFGELIVGKKETKKENRINQQRAIRSNNLNFHSHAYAPSSFNSNNNCKQS